MGAHEIECRPTSFTKGFTVLLTIYCVYHLIVTYGEYSLKEWIFLASCPLFIAISCFVFPTLRVAFDKNGIFSSWKVRIGSVVLYEKKTSIPWSSLRAVREIPPSLPPRLVFIEGYPRPEDTWYSSSLIAFGTMFTHSDDAWVYLGDHAPPNVLDGNVRKIIKRAEKRVRNTAEVAQKP